MFKQICMGMFFCVLLVGSCGAVREATTPEEQVGPKSVRSHLGNYTVTAPNLAMAASYAEETEDLRKAMMSDLGDNRKYNVHTYLTIQKAEGNRVGMDRWQVSVHHSGIMRRSAAILRNRIENATRFYVVYCYLLDVAAAEAALNKAKVRDDQIPLWICVAIMENLTRESREAHREYMVASLGMGKHIPFNKLFGHMGRFKDENERALYFHQCGSLFEYLVSLQRGRNKILESLRDLWQRNDLTISLLWHFRESFSSLEELEERWAEFTQERPKRFFDFIRLSDEDTRKRLADILIVRIVSIDEETIEEKVEETDLAGLMRHKNKKTKVSIALKKIVELHDLKLRAPNEYQEVLDEYIISLRAIVGDEKRKFRWHYNRANILLKKQEVN